MKRLAQGSAALLGLLVAAVVISGLVSPADHVASRELTLEAPVESVWTLVSGVERYADWRRDIESVRLEGNDDELVGRRFVELGDEGPVLFEIVEAVPPRHLVTRIADESLPFGGGWTLELRPTPGGGTVLRITEAGFVRSFLFRALGPLFSKTATMERWMTDLAAELGEEPQITAPDVTG